MSSEKLSGKNPPDSGPFIQFIGIVFLRLAGWKLAGGIPETSQMVVIAAPHTTNWDFIYLIAAAFSFRLKINWMGKASLFKPPLGVVMRWLGGIPIDRTRQTNLVAQLVAQVPIVCSYLDYPKRTAGMGLSFIPTSDIRADMDRVREIYKDIRGKYPGENTRIMLHEEIDSEGFE